MPLRNNAGAVVDAESWKEEKDVEGKGFWQRPVRSSASGAFPSYRSGEPATAATRDQQHAFQAELSRQALPSAEWIREMCKDARDLVIGCGSYVCSPSCFKYHSTKASQICRHSFYHRVTIYTEDEKHERRLRRRGKPLRGSIGIFRETDYGMAGRIITFQMHPWETSTNYASLVAMRCNVDVQDMRRVLPPRLWMNPSELEPAAKEEDRNTYNHGAYPQRYSGFSVGAQDTWGWMRHLNTTAGRERELVLFTDWYDGQCGRC